MALTDNLVAFWELDDLNDSVGGNALTNNGSTPFVSGKVGNAADFNGSSQYLSIPDNAALSMGDIDFTIQAWVKFDNFASTRVIVSKADSISGTCEYALYADSGSDLRFRVGTSLGYIIATWSSQVTTGVWYHVIAYNNAAADVIGIVVDGGTPVTESTAGTAVSDGTQAFTIGVDSPSAGRYLDGMADQVGVWKGRTLSGSEITQLNNGGAGLSHAAMSGGGGGSTPIAVFMNQYRQRRA